MALQPSATARSKAPQVQRFSVTRAMTTGTDRMFNLPKGSKILYYILSGTASDAGTSATLSIGTTSGTPVEHVNALDVKTAATGSGVGVLRGVAGAIGDRLTADTPIFVKVTEVGTASTVGSWFVFVHYVEGSSLSGEF